MPLLCWALFFLLAVNVSTTWGSSQCGWHAYVHTKVWPDMLTASERLDTPLLVFLSLSTCPYLLAPPLWELIPILKLWFAQLFGVLFYDLINILSDSVGLKKRWGSAQDGGRGAPRIKIKVRNNQRVNSEGINCKDWKKTGESKRKYLIINKKIPGYPTRSC